MHGIYLFVQPVEYTAVCGKPQVPIQIMIDWMQVKNLGFYFGLISAFPRETSRTVRSIISRISLSNNLSKSWCCVMQENSRESFFIDGIQKSFINLIYPWMTIWMPCSISSLPPQPWILAQSPYTTIHRDTQTLESLLNWTNLQNNIQFKTLCQAQFKWELLNY